jgi:hypothetical protein
MSQDTAESGLGDAPTGRCSAARHAVAIAGFVGGFVFLLAVAGIAVDDFFERAQDEADAEKLEVARWECVESFVRASTSDGERLRLQIEPADDTYIRQRVVESVYPEVDLADSGGAGVLRVVVRPGDDAAATCRGLDLSVDRP